MSSSNTALPVSPFHLACPVHDLDLARAFYRDLLGCEEGRSSKTWIDYNMGGAQIVCHWAGKDYRAVDYYNGVDKDMVPVPHHGLCLTVDEFHKLAKRVKDSGIKFIIEPGLRFAGAPGEQWTMFFKDPSGNNLEFKALVKPENLCAFVPRARERVSRLLLTTCANPAPIPLATTAVAKYYVEETKH